MNLRTIGLTVLLALGITATSAADRVKGNGTIVTRTIRVDDFHTLRLGNNIESSAQTVGRNIFKKDKGNTPAFYYTQSAGAASLEVTMDENLFNWLDIDQQGTTISIRSREKYTKLQPTELIIRGRSAKLNEVEVSGCMNFNAESTLDMESLRISVSGVADIRLDQLACGALTCDVSGVGNAYLTGRVGTGNFNVSGVGKVFAFDCAVKELSCELSGVGKMEVNATSHLSASTSGVGNIRYKGSATVNSSASGVGTVKRAD